MCVYVRARVGGWGVGVGACVRACVRVCVCDMRSRVDARVF